MNNIRDKAMYVRHFTTPEKCIRQKLDMLKYDFCIYPTGEELDVLYSKTTEHGIESVVRQIIFNHLGDD